MRPSTAHTDVSADDGQPAGPFEGILRASRALASSSDPARLVSAIVSDVFDATRSHVVQLWIADAAAGDIKVVAQRNAPGVQDVDAGNLPGRILATGQPVLAHTTDLLSPFFTHGHIPYASGIGVPIRDGSSVVGALTIFSHQQLGPSEFQIGLLFGDQLSIAMRFETMSMEIEHRERELELFAETAREIQGELEIDSLLDKVLDVAHRLFSSEAGFICLFETDTGALQLGLFRDISREVVVDVMERPEFRAVLREGAPRIIPRPEEDPVFQPLSGMGYIPLIIPLRAEGANAGLLVALIPEGQMPTAADLPLISSFATQAGLAVGNAMLYREIEDQRSELSSIIHSIRNPLIVIDESQKFIAVNGTAQELFGLAGSFDIGTPVRGRLRPPELEKLLIEGRGEMEVTITRPDPRSYKAKAVPLRGETGEVRGTLLVMDDITEQRELEQMKADFVSVIGHELRTPLTLIKGFARTLMKKGKRLPEESRAEALETIDAQTHRLERLIEDLLFVSAVEQQRPPLFLESLDLVEVLREIIDKLRAQNPDRAIVFDCPFGRLPLVFDAAKVEQILGHLIDNALKYSEDEVSVALAQKDDEVHISVSDRGVGIYSGDIPRLFQRFGQIDSSSTRAHGGTGLGLYICKRLVEVHEGHIWAESQLGRGSTFTFSIPRTLTPGSK